MCHYKNLQPHIRPHKSHPSPTSHIPESPNGVVPEFGVSHRVVETLLRHVVHDAQCRAPPGTLGRRLTQSQGRGGSGALAGGLLEQAQARSLPKPTGASRQHVQHARRRGLRHSLSRRCQPVVVVYAGRQLRRALHVAGNTGHDQMLRTSRNDLEASRAVQHQQAFQSKMK